MKKILSIVAVLAILVGCNNKKDDKVAEKSPENKVEDSITYPFTAAYSSDLSPGDPNHSKLVLDFIKSWVDNNFTAMRSFLADTMAVDFSDGSKFRGTADSLIKLGEQYRGMYTNVSITVDSWMPIHANDKNTDFVLVWEKDYNTDKQGKIDSMAYQNAYQITNNKISYWVEYQSKLLAHGPDK